jgi:hypothetical protein
MDKKYVKSSLMVRDEDIRLIGMKMFTPFYLNGQEKQIDGKTRPILSGIISPEMSITQHTTDNG